MSIQRALQFAANEWRFRRLHRKYKAYTMISPRAYAGNLHLAAKVAKVPGSVVECGVWRGGMIAGIAEVLGAGRRYTLCDSFEGLPPAKEVDGTAALAWQSNVQGPTYFNNCAAPEDEARAAMAKSPAKDVRFVKGWFDQTLSKLAPEPIALLRMDADWYESTKCILDNLVSQVVPGGMIIIDDYHTWEGCTLAVNEYAVAKKWAIRQNAHGVCYVLV